MNPALANNDKLNNISKGGVKILVAAGSSGGHIFPAVAFLEALKDKYSYVEALLLLPAGNISGRIEIDGYRVDYIQIPSLKIRVNFKDIDTMVKLMKGAVKSLFILLKFQPDIVVGFGSFTSLAAVTFGWLLRSKTLVHEQNVIPGRANKFLARLVDSIAVSFEETTGYLSNYKSKIAVTGNPLRKKLVKIDKAAGLHFFGLSPDCFTLLVMGGSQGSRKINSEFFKAVSRIHNKSAFQVIHLCGPVDYELLYKGYRDSNIKCAVFSFLDAIEYAYSVSDLAVCRAGATTVSEIIFFGVPALFIPYPYAYRHQYYNAKVLEKKGCSIIIEDDELNANSLKDILESFLYNRQRLDTMRAAYDAFPRLNASELLVREALSIE